MASRRRGPAAPRRFALSITKGGNYLVVRYGWRDGRRVRGVSLFVRMRDRRVFIEEDMTDWGIVDRLVEHGVPPEHIVLAWQSTGATTAEPVVA